MLSRIKRTKGPIPASEKDFYDLSLPRQTILAMLTAKSDEEKLKGLKILIAMQLSNKAVEEFIPAVVNLISDDMRVRRLAYYFIVHNCRKAKEDALMSVNSFHRELNDTTPLARASALRTLSSMQIDEILPVLQMTISTCVSDFSLYVRRAAAYALIKLSEWRGVDQSEVIQHLTKLLTDSHMYVVGPALFAFNVICPERLDLLHPFFRRHVSCLDDFDPCFIPAAVYAFMRYSKYYLDRQSIDPEARQDADLKLFLTACDDLLQLDDAAVTIAVVEALLLLSPHEKLIRAVPRLLSYKHCKKELAYLMLCLAGEIANVKPEILVPHFTSFFVSANDSR
jgi:AP-3 complex subunit beta